MTTTTNVSFEDLIAAATEAELAIRQAQRNYETKLQALVTHLGTSTFNHNGQWFQVRTRVDGDNNTMTYLCQLKGEPKTWLTGRPKNASVKRKRHASLISEQTEVALANATHDIVSESETTVEYDQTESDTVLE